MGEVIKITPPANSRVFVASDAHYWPGKPSTAHRALCYLLRSIKPNIVVMNGDALDAARISKHPPLGWEKRPSLEKELALVKARLSEIMNAANYMAQPKPRFVWAQGNHDARFDRWLATKAPDFQGVPGAKLADFFPEWEHCIRLEVGGKNGAIIKHEFKGGSNPLKSNLLAAGRTIVTGHHHCQNVLALTDSNGTRWGVDAGMLAAVNGPQFAYNEGNPVNWRSGFAVLNWRNGKLMPPSLATVVDEGKGCIWYEGATLYV